MSKETKPYADLMLQWEHAIGEMNFPLALIVACEGYKLASSDAEERTSFLSLIERSVACIRHMEAIDKAPPPPFKNDGYCSFCGKEFQQGNVVAGAGVFICGDCVSLASDMLKNR